MDFKKEMEEYAKSQHYFKSIGEMLNDRRLFREENLRAVFKETVEYHRSLVKSIFRVAIIAGTLFAGLMVLYITCTNYLTVTTTYSLSTNITTTIRPNPELQKLRYWAAWFGLFVGFTSLTFQVLSVKALSFFTETYIRPLLREMGMERQRTNYQRDTRNFYVRFTSIALYGLCMVYMTVWLWVLHQNHQIFN